MSPVEWVFLGVAYALAGVLTTLVTVRRREYPAESWFFVWMWWPMAVLVATVASSTITKLLEAYRTGYEAGE